MGSGRLLHILFPLSLLLVIPFASGWGYDGHIAICRIAQACARLNKGAAEAVRKLLPASANDDLGSLCPWADRIKMRYHWSSDLHFITTPDHLCSYRYTNNLTEALLFLSHFIGDIHQPLHVGFTTDKGGNTIKVTWFNRKQVLHHVWDTDIIRKEEEGFNASNVDDFIKKIQQKIKSQWANQVNRWEACSGNQKTCPNVYAEESIKAACQWAYKGVHPGSVLKEGYYGTRSPIVELRLAQAGIRLAATLNRIFT
ncbi:hypothetical protein Pfo_009701 [Paulownia fortunei]|nr:hypothetical protein Pfo_009701 [Paulownia fortunei]